VASAVIVCVRHGETEWKCQGRTQGQSDSPLTAAGAAQAEGLAGQLAGESFAQVYTSPLGRTVQTATILAAGLGLPQPTMLAELAEQGEGAFEGLTRPEQMQRFTECFAADGRLDPRRIPGAEPLEDFLGRAQQGLRLLRGALAGGPVLAVTHAGIMLAFVALAEGRDYLDVCEERHFPFCGLLRLDASGEVAD